MNPTEYFISELHKLLQKHEKETGTYIETVRIDRVAKAVMQKNEKLRIERPVVEIRLEIS